MFVDSRAEQERKQERQQEQEQAQEQEQQGQEQAKLTAAQQLAQQKMMQPLTAAQQYGSGVTGLIAGYPGQVTMGQQAVPTPLQTAIGAGATLAGIYRAI